VRVRLLHRENRRRRKKRMMMMMMMMIDEQVGGCGLTNGRVIWIWAVCP